MWVWVLCRSVSLYFILFMRHLLSPLQRTHTLPTHFRHDFSNIIRYFMSLHISYFRMFHIRTNYLITILLGSRIEPYRKECSNIRTLNIMSPFFPSATPSSSHSTAHECWNNLCQRPWYYFNYFVFKSCLFTSEHRSRQDYIGTIWLTTYWKDTVWYKNLVWNRMRMNWTEV